MKLVIQSESLTSVQIDQITQLLTLCDWNKAQIDGQIHTLQKFIKDKDCVVLLAIEASNIIGYASAQFYPWNRLGQIHGLAIQPLYRQRGIASKLIDQIEAFMREKDARGLYADTPVNNTAGRLFYKNNHFLEAYIMPEYYDKGLDGITYLKLYTIYQK